MLGRGSMCTYLCRADACRPEGRGGCGLNRQIRKGWAGCDNDSCHTEGKSGVKEPGLAMIDTPLGAIAFFLNHALCMCNSSERGLVEERKCCLGSPKWNTKAHVWSRKQRQRRPRSGPSKGAHMRTEGWKYSDYWVNIEKKESNYYQKLLEIERKIVREGVRGDKHNLRKCASCNCKTQISTMCGVNDNDLCSAICRISQVVFVTSIKFTHNLLFYFQQFLVIILPSTQQLHHTNGKDTAAIVDGTTGIVFIRAIEQTVFNWKETDTFAYSLRTSENINPNTLKQQASKDTCNENQWQQRLKKKTLTSSSFNVPCHVHPAPLMLLLQRTARRRISFSQCLSGKVCKQWKDLWLYCFPFVFSPLHCKFNKNLHETQLNMVVYGLQRTQPFLSVRSKGGGKDSQVVGKVKLWQKWKQIRQAPHPQMNLVTHSLPTANAADALPSSYLYRRHQFARQVNQYQAFVFQNQRGGGGHNVPPGKIPGPFSQNIFKKSFS